LIDASDKRLMAWLATLPPRDELIVRMAHMIKRRRPPATKAADELGPIIDPPNPFGTLEEWEEFRRMLDTLDARIENLAYEKRNADGMIELLKNPPEWLRSGGHET